MPQNQNMPPSYDDLPERDACGTGFVCDIQGRPSHTILEEGLHALIRLEHRGAVSSDGKTSDGAGIMTQIPWGLLEDDFPILRDSARESRALAMVFLPEDPTEHASARQLLEDACASFGLKTLTWRDVPTNRDELGSMQKDRAPNVCQLVVASQAESLDQDLYLARRKAESLGAKLVGFSIPSMSSQTVVYKALVIPSVLPLFYADLADPRFETAMVLFHQRYSTNTFANWALAQPLRMLAHNGEINTLLGNVNRQRAREQGWQFNPESAGVFGEHLETVVPVIQKGGSDSMALDNVLEMLCVNGKNPIHAMRILVPEAYQAKSHPPAIHAFYRYHAALMEPWDGPAALVFTNGRSVGAALDRNGLRPLRFWITKDRVIVASEAGVVPVPDEEITKKGRLGPGQMVSVNTATGRIFFDDEIRQELAGLEPWEELMRSHDTSWDVGEPEDRMPVETLVQRQKMFGWSREHAERILEPIVIEKREPIGSMGDDTPLAALSENPQRLYRFFKQRFAQVTNPPIDPIRESLVMSLRTRLGGVGSLLGGDKSDGRLVEFSSPVLNSAEFRSVCEQDIFPVQRLDATWPVSQGVEGLEKRLNELVREAEAATVNGVRVIILSDRVANGERAPVPMLLASGAIHHGLIGRGLRMKAAVVCDAGDVLEDHDVAALLSFGALLVYPRLALESAVDLAERLMPESDAVSSYIGVVEKGLKKIMAKLGISTMASYRGAQTFEVLGIADEVVERYFCGTPSRIGGVTLEDIAAHVLEFHASGWGEDQRLRDLGIYRFRRDGEYHAFNPNVFKPLHKAVRQQDSAAFEEYRRNVDDRPPMALRDLMTWQRASTPLSLDEVESADDIVKRFCTQAMSFGALSREAHETLAVAMNRIGGKSNSGEGGEEAPRYTPYTKDAPERSLGKWHPQAGDSGGSAIKQVASGRFGVTPAYLVSASELEIKMAQGSKPGEGGQIPGDKVTEDIAKTRRSVPGIMLISPPPHHDIYSIEDLAQLIYDLKRVNQHATVCVKLVSGVGVGTIAAGVAKGYADTIQISGHDGGTGASPLASIKHAGLPWELGLAETQQVLVANGMRGRVKLRVDGGLKTGRDVVISALIGAEEFGFGTAPLVAAGCVMARQCHANTCPVGIATQRDDLRMRYPGTPEHVIAFMYFLAEHVRHILAEMGVRTLGEIIGRIDLLQRREGLPERAKKVKLDAILREPKGSEERQKSMARNDRPEPEPLDERILKDFGPSIAQGNPLEKFYQVDNRDRSLGARLAGEVARVHGDDGLADNTFVINLEGAAGQSLGAFAPKGMTLRLKGEAQDGVGKSLAGGVIMVSPAGTLRSDDVLVGNTCMYGATSGSLFVAGMAGERLAVRNSGGTVVVEGCGDHGCEYMTHGTVLILGPTGLNFAAGMSGGRAYVWDPAGELLKNLNHEMATHRRPDAADAPEIEYLLRAHKNATGSALATKILDEFDLGVFWVVSA